MIYIAVLVSLCCGAGIAYLCLRHKLKEKQQLDYTQKEELNRDIQELQVKLKTVQQDINEAEVVRDKNTKEYLSNLEDLRLEHQVILNKTKEIQQKKEEREKEYNQLNIKVTGLLSKRDELSSNLTILERQQKEAGQKFFDSAKELAQKCFDDEIEQIAVQLEQNRNEAQEEYAATLKECVDNFQQEIAARRSELQQLDAELMEAKSIVASAVADRKRTEEQSTNRDFYRLQLSTDDLQEIKKLREVLPYLRDKEPLNKVIYKVYYEKPYTNLVGRVLGQEKHTGIYKITNLQNGMTYVGQSVDIASRWKQHIRRGVGADAPTKNKLYPAMLEIGVENFTFELIEDCSADKLDKQEKFWQEYFHSQDYGYSIK